MEKNILICIKPVPDVGGKINLTDDNKNIDAKNLGLTISPHEECAVEEAIQIVEKNGGSTTVLTLATDDAQKQLRDSLARGVTKAVLLETEDSNWNANQTAAAIANAIKDLEAANGVFDVIMFGGESADRGNSQVGILVAHVLGRPSVSWITGLDIEDDKVLIKRECDEGTEIYEVAQPVIVSVRDGMNQPRFPSLRGTMQARKKPLESISVSPDDSGCTFAQFSRPEVQSKQTEFLGNGPEAAAKVVELLKKLELV